MRVRDPRSIFFRGEKSVARSSRGTRVFLITNGSTVGNDDERALSYRRHWKRREGRRIGSKVTELDIR